MNHLLEMLIAALLTGGFACVGEVVLRRRSADLASWNESFLAGMGVCAAALFPLSLLSPHGALRLELVVMGFAVVVTLVLRQRKPAEDPAMPPSAGRDPIAGLLLVAIAVVVVLFAALDLRYNLGWDAFQIWATKAQLLFYQGGLGRTWYPGDTYEIRHISYPSLIPMFEALLDVVKGGFDFDSFKPIFIPFHLSMLVATWAAARAVLSARLALAATLLVALLPLLSTQHAASGYADMPEAAFVAGIASAALRRRSRPGALPWLIGGLTTVKSEGTILAALAAGGVLFCWLIERPPDLRARLRSQWKAVAIVLAFLGLRFALVRWVGASDVVYPLDASHLAEALHRIPRVVRLCLVKMLSPRRWGLFWPAFFASALVLALRGTSREKCIVLAVGAASVVLASAFLFTTWPLELHIDQAYGRLLSQLAPAAGVAVAIGYARARGDLEPAV